MIYLLELILKLRRRRDMGGGVLFLTLYRVFIKYCVFFRRFENIPDSGIFSLGVSVCTHTRQVENQRCCRTGRVQKNHKILRKKHNI